MISVMLDQENNLGNNILKKMQRSIRTVVGLFVILFLPSCVSGDFDTESPLELTKADFSDLDGWRSDYHSEALGAFRISCSRIIKQSPEKKFGPLDSYYGDWQYPCREALSMSSYSNEQAKEFFERFFEPWRASAGNNKKGLFTGYYEPSLQASLVRHGNYQTPVYARPDDLVMVDLGEFRDNLKGQRIAGRVNSGRLRPFEDRSEITAGKLSLPQEKIIAWSNDPVGVFFLQIQGSGRLILDNGNEIRVGYDGQNGHPYYAIGRELIKRGELEKEKVSLQSIRIWLESNPDLAQEIMNTNRSYVFFRTFDGEGPLGGEGVPLTPGRSLAVDRAKLAYGVPIWLNASSPVDREPPLRRLLVSQDTGGAINGAVRGDVFWGYGKRAEYLAGYMKSEGSYWLLLPKKNVTKTR